MQALTSALDKIVQMRYSPAMQPKLTNKTVSSLIPLLFLVKNEPGRTINWYRSQLADKPSYAVTRRLFSILQELKCVNVTVKRSFEPRTASFATSWDCQYLMALPDCYLQQVDPLRVLDKPVLNKNVYPKFDVQLTEPPKHV